MNTYLSYLHLWPYNTEYVIRISDLQYRYSNFICIYFVSDYGTLQKLMRPVFQCEDYS
jgi:hypothetical protein